MINSDFTVVQTLFVCLRLYVPVNNFSVILGLPTQFFIYVSQYSLLESTTEHIMLQIQCGYNTTIVNAHVL